MRFLITAAIAVYRANPLRPHCRPGHHVRLCRLIIPRLDTLISPQGGVSFCFDEDTGGRRDDTWCFFGDD